MKVPPFVPTITADGIRTVRVMLDPSQAYLNDHRPGGDPLFGTVMSIEVVSRCALLMAPEMRVQVVESIENHAPFVLKAAMVPEIEVTLMPDRTGQGIVLQCAVASAGVEDTRHVHMQATLRLALKLDGPAYAPAFAEPRGVMPVTAKEIYSLFFHGPALRVVDAACWEGGQLYARSAPDLPPCFSMTDHTVAAPRLIEFALQSAGLFEIAVNNRMMIPHAIRRIQRFAEFDIDCGRQFWAVVSRSPQGITVQDLDVEVFDTDGRCHLRIDAYQTLPLPFAVNPVGVAALSRCFSRSCS